ncbi:MULTISPECIES: YkvA family protein [Pseudoalteromonas]|jgi:uncharacterized membrane protein YkvA (DUF1232 family)|uniref:DUF1232 domain-containing protein n=1 Tax=Pseudoalteromonas aliena SW19 TaxID=1314866 RepID=A0ABR9E3U0_9GAMM|nr:MULTISPECIES: YkvA family protein [Pseudoalteromonas]MBE0361276.1 hypothetical protein [Pseudoalteromonas aliena SW19]
MAFEVKFELSDTDLEHFRDVMRKAQQGAKLLSEQVIINNAKKISLNIKDNVPEFVRLRIQKLETFVAMIEDAEWQIPEDERVEILSALAYFSDPEDLVPDHIPVLGFLDDAIMIELVAGEFSDDVEAFEEFCAYRSREEGRNGNVTITRDEWLDAKRRELHSRMRNRRNARRSSGRSSFRSVF